MFDSQKFTGTQYTTTVALLIVACVFVPATLFISRPEPMSLGLAGVCSVFCMTLAWFQWRRHSELTIPSIVTERIRKSK